MFVGVGGKSPTRGDVYVGTGTRIAARAKPGESDHGPLGRARRWSVLAGLVILGVVVTACGASEATTTAVAPPTTEATPTSTQIASEPELFVQQGTALVNDIPVAAGDFRTIEFGDEISVDGDTRVSLTAGEFAFELYLGAVFTLQELDGPELSAFLERGLVDFSFKDEPDGRLFLETPISRLTTSGDARFTVCQPANDRTCVAVDQGAVELEFDGRTLTYRGDGTIVEGAFVEAGMPPGAKRCISMVDFTAWKADIRKGVTSPPLGRFVNDSLECGARVIEVDVLGNVAWTPTGVDVAVGDRVAITAKGFVTHATPGTPVDPDGDPNEGLHVFNIAGLPDASHGALIGRIGEEGEPFLLGISNQFVSDTEGQLWLGINDIDVTNNGGGFNVDVAVTAS